MQVTYVGVSDEVEQSLPDGTRIIVRRGEAIDTTDEHARGLAEGESWVLGSDAKPIEAEPEAEPERLEPEPEPEEQEPTAGEEPEAEAGAETSADEAEEGEG
jgi:hypothetical protein